MLSRTTIRVNVAHGLRGDEDDRLRPSVERLHQLKYFIATLSMLCLMLKVK